MTATDTTTEPAEALSLGTSFVYLQMLTEEKWAAIAVPEVSPAPVGLPQIVDWAAFDQFDVEQGAVVDGWRHENAVRAAAYNEAETARRAEYYGSSLPPLPKRLRGASLPVLPALPPAPERDPFTVTGGGTIADVIAAAPVAEVLPELPPAQEAALETFNALHDAEDAEPGTAVIDLDAEEGK